MSSSLLNDCQLYLAEATMVYLYAELRALSATGYTTTKFQQIGLGCDGIVADARSWGEIIVALLRESRSNTVIRNDTTEKEEEQEDEIKGLITASQEAASLLKSLDDMIGASLRESGMKFKMCPTTGKPYQWEIEKHQHAGNPNSCLCANHGLHYCQVIVDHAVTEERQKKARQDELLAKSNLEPIVIRYFKHYFLPLRKKVPTKTQQGEETVIQRQLLDSQSTTKAIEFLQQEFKPTSFLGRMLAASSSVVYFSDKYPEFDIVYGIATSRIEKKVMLTFRGTVTIGNWIKNIQTDLVHAESPLPTKCRYIEVHHGFYDYMLRKRRDNGRRKYDQVAERVHAMAMKNIGSADYELICSGHSLGGALATLFSLYASVDERFQNNDSSSRRHPIKVFSYGSPYVGGVQFASCFLHQELSGKLCHLRTTVEQDVIPKLPAEFQRT